MRDSRLLKKQYDVSDKSKPLNVSEGSGQPFVEVKNKPKFSSSPLAEPFMKKLKNIFKKNNPGNIKLTSDQLRLYGQGKFSAYKTDKGILYRAFLSKKDGLKDIARLTHEYDKDNLTDIFDRYKAPDESGQAPMSTEDYVNVVKNQDPDAFGDSDKIDFTNERQVKALIKGITFAENDDYISSDLKEKGIGVFDYYTDKDIEKATNEFVNNLIGKRVQQSRPLSSIPGIY
tara:strand:- start:75 stop:764 length:690 start_codon:yes stop_codon:yes gene_type:complete